MSKTVERPAVRATAVLPAKSAVKRSRVKFGTVTVVVPKPTSAQIKLNVAASSLALERVAKRILKPGVKLRPKKNVPQYAADTNRPGVYIRVLNGRKDRGVLKDGAFKVVE
jgi:hypothetical protein